jgi:hypothetical protein
LPHLGDAGDQQERDDGLRRTSHEVGAGNDEVAGQAVRPNTANEKEQHLWRNPGGENEPQRGGGSVYPNDGKGDRSRRHRIAQERHPASRCEEGEVATSQESKTFPHGA